MGLVQTVTEEPSLTRPAAHGRVAGISAHPPPSGWLPSLLRLTVVNNRKFFSVINKL